MKTQFLGGSYESRSLPLAAQTLVNLFHEAGAPDAPGEGMFYGSPGLRLLDTIGSGPIRATHTAGGHGWIVSGAELYRRTSAGVVTLIGAVGGSGRVCLVSNDTQLVVMHSAGWELVTLATLGYGSVPGAPTTAQGAYQDSYVVFPNTNGTYGWTAIGNAGSVPALNFASAEAQPDPIISTLSDHRELWLFGETTTEIAQTSGDADLVFTRTAMLEHGCAAKYSPAKADNTVLWLGRDPNGRGVVYKAEGYSPLGVSTRALETEIAGYGDISDAWGYCYQQNGHTFYVLTFPDRATWALDLSSNRWTLLAFRNESTGELEQHRGGAYTFHAGQHLIGDRETGQLYELDLDTYTDNGAPKVWERAWAVIQAEGKFIRHEMLQIMAEMGVGLDGSAQGSDPVILLDWSDDGCRTWSSARELSIGRLGNFKLRAFKKRLGLSRHRVYRLRGSDPVKTCLYGANLDAKALAK